MRRHHMIAYAVLAMVLAACGPNTENLRIAAPTTAIAPTMSRLVLYRPDSEIYSVEASIVLDGTPTCGISPGDQLVWELAPGVHKLAVSVDGTPGTSMIPVTTEPGKTTTVAAYQNAKRIAAGAVFGFLGALASSDSSSPRGGHLYIEIPPPDVAAKEVAGLSPLAGCPFRGRQMPSAQK